MAHGLALIARKCARHATSLQSMSVETSNTQWKTSWFSRACMQTRSALVVRLARHSCSLTESRRIVRIDLTGIVVWRTIGRKNEADIYPRAGFWMKARDDALQDFDPLAPLRINVYPCVPAESCVGFLPQCKGRRDSCCYPNHKVRSMARPSLIEPRSP